MSPVRGSFTIPVLAVIAFAASLAWFGYRSLRSDTTPVPGATAIPAPAPSPTARADGPALPPGPMPSPDVAPIPDRAPSGPPAGRARDRAETDGSSAPAREPAVSGGSGPIASAAPPLPIGTPGTAPVGVAPSGSAPAGVAPEPSRAGPSFDVVRVEPTGESVIAGRAPAEGRVELVVDGRPLAVTQADVSGAFAFVPPALPPGSHEIVLRAAGPNGAVVQSGQSVTVVIAAGTGAPPLVTVSAPGEPTVVLSRPDAPQAVASAAPGTPAVTPARAPAAPAPSTGSAAGGTSAGPTVGQTDGTHAGVPSPAAASPRRAGHQALQIASVETESAGRLYVSGSATPGARVRLYLNEAYLAQAEAGRDGRFAFAIERGVRPGSYRVRLDEVDAARGAVHARAEVVFTVPPTVVAAAEPHAPQPAASAPPRPAPSASVAQAPSTNPPAEAAASAREAPPVAGTARPSGLPEGSREAAGAGHPPSAGPAAPAGPAPTVVATAAPPGPGSAAAPAGPVPPERDGVRPVAVVVPQINTALVSRGDSLWAISKRTYGEGERYTVIYGANSPQIRDPDLIYPGQIFVLPGEPRRGAAR